VVEIDKGEPLQIGVYQVLSGPDTANGVDQKRAIEIAFAERDNILVGHPVLLHIEDSQCTPEGGQTAATKLAAISDLVIVLGPSCSSEATAGAPILWNAGIPSIGTSTSAPRLTAPERGLEFAGFLRTSYNDNDVGSSAADWAYNVLGVRRATTIHDGSVYTEQLANVFAEQFTALGGTITSREAVSPTDSDMRPVLTRIAADAPELIFYPVFVNAAGHITRQAKEIDGLEETQLLGSDAVFTREMIVAAGRAVVGFSFVANALEPDALGEGYPAFVERYKQTYGEAPIQGSHHQAYDAASIAIAAIEKAAVTNDEGDTYIGRQALLDALYATRDHKGLTGILSCTEHGDCGHFNFAVYEFTNSDPESFSPGVNPKKVYP
jgi:branched-chain amino acid transport system substrate-binding protein